jgi:hypothetical protein
LTKLVIDWPVKYTDKTYGDTTFVLAHLYKSNEDYKEKINRIKSHGRELMLDNGAWEFGSSMPPTDYKKIVDELEPDIAVIPDVYMNRLQSEKVTSEYIGIHDRSLKTKLMFVPQGQDPIEAVNSYDKMVSEYGIFYDILGAAKWLGKYINRLKWVDQVWISNELQPQQVHLLGFWNFKELAYDPEFEWDFISIDTKYPVKQSYYPETFDSQLDYYNTDKPLNLLQLGLAVNQFYVKLDEMGWLDTGR